ncbi:Protein of unknown function DUF2358 [Dillenia turbinata]|uniref:Uncharacterized protein n=1 Tax=Dillenia turbinata TaxID=194707 RepID=A0AAN8ZL92_9MAGN
MAISEKCPVLTRPYEITRRWTIVMTFVLLAWKPELIFTGTSVMGINPENKKFRSCMDVFKQLWIYKMPHLETPKYQTLKRTAYYVVQNVFVLSTWRSTIFLLETTQEEEQQKIEASASLPLVFRK